MCAAAAVHQGPETECVYACAYSSLKKICIYSLYTTKNFKNCAIVLMYYNSPYSMYIPPTTPVRPIIIMWRRSTLFGDLLFCRVVKISSSSVIYLWINVLCWGVEWGGYRGEGKKPLLKRCHCEIINDALQVLQSNIVSTTVQ